MIVIKFSEGVEHKRSFATPRPGTLAFPVAAQPVFVLDLVRNHKDPFSNIIPQIVLTSCVS